MNIRTALSCLGLALAMLPASTFAQYPNKPIRLIVPFAAGGPTDSVARTVAQAISKGLGQAVLVENRPGADGAIAAQSVITAAPDGYTLFFTTSSVLALQIVAKPPPFDAERDFAPVCGIGRFAFAMYANPSVPARTLRELLAYARANPGKLNYATVNVGEQFAAAHVMRSGGFDMVRVPYKGYAQLMPDLLENRVQVYFGPMAAGLQQVKEGKLRMLATFLGERSAAMPDVPTLAEAGLPALEVQGLQMILAPVKTPADIVQRLSREAMTALQDPALRAALEKHVFVVDGSTPQKLADDIVESNRLYSAFVRDSRFSQ